MTSLQSQADAATSAVSSISTCSAATAVLLKDLLLSKNEESPGPSTGPSRPAKAARSTKCNATSKVPAEPKRVKPTGGRTEELSAKEKANLATQVINCALKSLGNASKPPQSPTPSRRQEGYGDLVKTATRNALRRSSSAPMTPLQPRSLNRQSTSPGVTKQHARSPSSASISSGCLATVECARVALHSLRTLQDSRKITLPEFQLESAMSTFIGKLIGLGLHDQACKELRILKRRLDVHGNGDTRKATKPTSEDMGAGPRALSDLLAFRLANPSGPHIRLVIATQLQVLRILSAQKKPAHTEAALQYLEETCKFSPIRLIILSATDVNADGAKVARQMEMLSQILLSLTPSVASKDDGAAVEPRLSISPMSAFKIQCIGLLARLHTWRIGGHKGDVDSDVLSPFSRCLSSFLRRNLARDETTYNLCVGAFRDLDKQIQRQESRPSDSSKSPSTTIFQLLITVSRESGQISGAITWATKLRDAYSKGTESAAKICSVAAQLLSLTLKEIPTRTPDVSLLKEVLEGVQGPLKGDTAELDELLVNVCSVRRSAMNVLLAQATSSEGEEGRLPSDLKRLLESFILQCPRFCLRWLGKPPSPKDSTKDYLRYEQRRQLLLKSVQHTLDSALMTIKQLLDESRLDWDLLDSVLHDSLTLLEYLGDFPTATSSQSYHVKISYFFYVKCNTLRQKANDFKDPVPLRALRHSIECLKYRSSKEREEGLLILKLERLADLCRSSGRIEEALGALQTIRSSLVEDGILNSLVTVMASQPPLSAWTADPKAEGLSRALVCISKLESAYVDWTTDLTDLEKAAVLEHRLRVVLLGNARTNRSVTLDDPCVDSLLRIYSPMTFPIRRLRTLLHLLCNSLGSRDQLAEILSITDDAIQSDFSSDLGEDHGLADYLDHMKAFYFSLARMAEPSPDVEAFRKAVSGWRAILDRAGPQDDLEKFIDNADDLLAHLSSVADFLRAKGHGPLSEVLELSADIAKRRMVSKTDDFVNHHSALALQYASSGQSSRAEEVFTATGHYAQEHDDLSPESLTTFHLLHAEYLLSVANSNKAEEYLSKARVCFDAGAQKILRASRKMIFAHASFLNSLAAFERGDSHHALLYSRDGVRVLLQDWVRLEGQDRQREGADKSTSPEEENSLGVSSVDAQPCVAGPAYWRLFYPLIRSISRLSNLYAHFGMFQETVYYAEQARTVARSMNSELYIAGCEAWLGAVWLKAAKPDKALECVEEARSLLARSQKVSALVPVACRLAGVYGELRDSEAEAEMLGMTQALLETITAASKNGANGTGTLPQDGLESQMAKLSIAEKKTTTGRRSKPRPARMAAKGASAAGRKAAATPQPVAVAEDVGISNLRKSIAIQRAKSLLTQRDWPAVIKLLQELQGLPYSPATAVWERLLVAASLLGNSIDEMARDPVYSVVQDSTISFPSITHPQSEKSGGERSSSTKSSPGRKGHAAAVGRQEHALEDVLGQGYVDNLREAQECLLEAHSLAALAGDSALVHKLSQTMQSVAIFLTAASSSKARLAGHTGYAACSVELARNLTWRRERKVVATEKVSTKQDGTDWPVLLSSSDSRRSSFGLSNDTQRFQREFIDIIPKSWNAISISLSENNHDLCIARFHANNHPFVIRLPLERASSRDADNAAFNFQQGLVELREIVRLANETCHDARDMSVKGAKTAWWAEREALDVRLKELLENIENIWLGGFKGIFSQHMRRPELLATFQKAFQRVLDKHLPSRRQVRGKRAAKGASVAKITLDLRILELFVGLGDATAAGCDFDEALTDLLYFVVDVLQFSGERNAYDEIDFDSMVVETFDALHAYHSAVRSAVAEESGAHTILVLDKSLHEFPWESLPCMQGQAVSRVPSLACLRRLLLDQQPTLLPSDTASGAEDGGFTRKGTGGTGHHISLDSVTCILNPGGDLKATQAAFERPLSAVSASWTHIAGRAPTEVEFERALAASDLLLYFGHGSGAQYVRGRAVRRLEPSCRGAWPSLGCSSAALPDVGAFEPHGPVWNYLLAGCPAVVGTLWDVTDRDIDRFAGRVFEEWGLVERGCFAPHEGKGREKGRAAGSNNGSGGKRGVGRRKAAGDATEAKGEGEGDDESSGGASLAEAVARARGACRFRYLTAAAACVYGIPVYVNK